ncbi:DUF4373 domain-containing protein [Anaerobacillus sp. CMMVII]|uniref:Lin1244/Lin1753 domain-containing protein n=1 Tax=Anaerobacillus sp. CMMVII TaxID=2755588 RepID=UPI0021B6F81D|nr:Lin1244/Lin1753 domain-containing protein [Anaerobacillus sp. CMMVII]MCT8138620.1 DUF4373 domain-containing protein [Anaerobacillus sp. CMMVII]
MARPQKNGLEYFALDVVLSDEVELIEAEHGLEGFAILIKMFQKIYSQGYYYEWDEKQKILFSNKVSSDRNLVVSVIEDCVRWGIFNKDLYEKYSILTSKRAQNHYITAIYKRVNVQMIEEYLLVDVSDKKNIEVYKISGEKGVCNGVSDDGNEETSTVSDGESTQSKSKVKVKVNKESNNTNAFEFYQQNFGIINSFLSEEISLWIDDLSEELVIEAMKRGLEQNKRNWGYVKSILKSWHSTNVKSIQDVKAEDVQFQKRQDTKKQKNRVDKLPKCMDKPEKSINIPEVSESEKQRLQKMIAELKSTQKLNET